MRPISQLTCGASTETGRKRPRWTSKPNRQAAVSICLRRSLTDSACRLATTFDTCGMLADCRFCWRGTVNPQRAAIDLDRHPAPFIGQTALESEACRATSLTCRRSASTQAGGVTIRLQAAVVIALRTHRNVDSCFRMACHRRTRALGPGPQSVLGWSALPSCHCSGTASETNDTPRLA